MAIRDKIVIPITIETEESADIRKLIEDLKQVENVPDKLQSKRKNQKMKSGTGAPIQKSYDESKGPIFGGEQEGFAFPDQSRDRSSKQAIQTNKQFKELKKEVFELKSSLLSNGVGKASQLTSLFTNTQGTIISFFSTYAPIIGPILLAKGLMDSIIAELTKDGGFLDRRFKRNIQTEVQPMFSRQYKAEIAAGLRDVRITSYPGERQKGQAGVMSTQMYIKVGKPIYDANLDQVAKGVL